MAYSSMHDLLNKDFASCSLGEKTSVTDAGLTVSIKREKDEKITFFQTDCEDARKCMCMPIGERKSCDYLIIYYKNSQNIKAELVCLLELKGEHFNDSVVQILNTHKYINGIKNGQISNKQHCYILWRASICSHGQAPSPQQKKLGQEKLKKLFGKDNVHVKHGLSGTYKDLGDKLRKWYSQ